MPLRDGEERDGGREYSASRRKGREGEECREYARDQRQKPWRDGKAESRGPSEARRAVVCSKKK